MTTLHYMLRTSARRTPVAVRMMQRRAVSALATTANGTVAGKNPNEAVGHDQHRWVSSEATPAGWMNAEGFLEFDTLHELQHRASHVFEKNTIFGTYSEQTKQFEYMTYGEYGANVEKCRAVLQHLGVGEFSKVGIIANNRWEWPTVAAAAYSLNATLVPMYEAQRPSDWLYILNDSGCEAVFCASQEIFNLVQRDVLPNAPGVRASLCLDAPAGEPHAFATYMETHASDRTTVTTPAADDLANLVYTSGTTGKPKGVELLHSNSVSNVKAVRYIVDKPHELVNANQRTLAFLPWAHSYGQTCELWCGLAHGSSMGICRGVPTYILEDLQLVRPTALFAVPTLYKRVYDGVQNAMETASPLRKSLMKNGLHLGKQNVDASRGLRAPLSFWERLQFSMVDRLVLSKIRDRLGGNLTHGFVAGAACPREVIDFFDNVGIPICEGYGLTETSPMIAVNTPENRKPGFVGQPLAGVTVVIADPDGNPVQAGDEGEICCYGPNVMRGYYKNPTATEEVMSVAPDGVSRMFHTGDLGRMDENGWVKVTGRVKELYKLENGKYVCPTPIEEAIGMSRFISQVVLCGANRPFNVALVVPDWAAVRTELNMSEDAISNEELARHKAFRSLLGNEIQRHCAGLKKFEVPQDWDVVEPFTVANNFLTPKMSIRRHMVIRAYDDLISAMYTDDAAAARHMDAAMREEQKASAA